MPQIAILEYRVVHGPAYGLREKGFRLLTADEAMRNLAEASSSKDPQVRNFWFDEAGCIVTSDVIAHRGDGKRFKVNLTGILNDEVYGKIHFKDGIPITLGQYEEMPGQEFIMASVGNVKFIVSAKKYNERKRYNEEEMYKIGAVPVARILDSIRINGKLIDERSNSDFLLFLARGKKKVISHYSRAVSHYMGAVLGIGEYGQVEIIEQHGDPHAELVIIVSDGDVSSESIIGEEDTKHVVATTKLIDVPSVRAYTKSDLEAASKSLERIKREGGAVLRKPVETIDSLLRKL